MIAEIGQSDLSHFAFCDQICIASHQNHLEISCEIHTLVDHISDFAIHT